MLFQKGYQNHWQLLRCGFTTDLQKSVGLCSDLLVSASSLTVWNHHKNSMLKRICSELADRKCSEQGDATTKSHPSPGFYKLQIRIKKHRTSWGALHSIIYNILHRMHSSHWILESSGPIYTFLLVMIQSHPSQLQRSTHKGELTGGSPPKWHLDWWGKHPTLLWLSGSWRVFVGRTALKEGIESVFSSD